MTKIYRGACERGVDRRIAEQAQTIEINWVNMSAKEAGSGAADRITKKLVDAGYRPDGACCIESSREAYEAGRKVDGRYIRLPQEEWRRVTVKQSIWHSGRLQAEKEGPQTAATVKGPATRKEGASNANQNHWNCTDKG